MVRRQTWQARHFRIESNRGVPFEFESNLEASQVPTNLYHSGDRQTVSLAPSSLLHALFSFRYHGLTTGMTAAFTFKQTTDALYDRADDHVVVIPSFSEIGTKLHLENVKTCVSIGSGSGRMDACLERCMPDLTDSQLWNLILKMLQC